MCMKNCTMLMVHARSGSKEEKAGVTTQAGAEVCPS